MRKTSFLAKRNALLSPGGISVGAFVLLLALLVCALRVLAPNTFMKFTAPLFRAGESVADSVYTLTSGFRSAAALSKANEALMEENAALSAENRTLAERIADFSDLATEADAGIIAGVVARPPESPYDSFILSAGAANGVTVGMEGFGKGGVPLGLITSVTADFSRLTLFSKSGIRENGWVGKSRIPLTLVGEGGGTFSAEVPRSALVSPGDVAFMAGPGAVPVGSVAKAGGSPSDPSVSLVITPAVNVFSTVWVTLRHTGKTEFASSTAPLP